MNRRRGLLPTLLLALLAALATGCSGAGGQPAGSGTTTPPTASAAPSTRAARTSTAAPTTTAVPTTAAPVRYRYPVAGCRATYGQHSGYPAADMFTGRGCAFVAPVAGRVDEVTRVDSWRQASDLGADRGGRSVSVVGVDGVRYYGSHLEAIAPGIAPGTRVAGGQPLGRVGNSGSARITPVHLHFGISWPTRPGIWWVRRGMVPPQRYLDSWRDGGNLSPVRAVRAARKAAGAEVPECQVRC
jgi:murein DD-endopeptidase MepM/ murein hydrolase activator NlpD